MIRRFILGSLAHLFSFSLHLLYVILSVPLIIIFWGAEALSAWMVLNAYSLFFQVSDLGLSTTIPNQIHELGIKKKNKLAVSCLVNGSITLCLSYLLIITGSWFYLAWCLNSSVIEQVYSKDMYLTTILLLGLSHMISSLGCILVGVYRIFNLNALGVLWNAGQKASLLIALLLVVPLTKQPSVLVIAMLVLQLTVLALMIRDVRVRFKDFIIDKLRYSWNESRALISCGLKFLPMQIGNIIYFNGLTISVGETMGSNAVAVFGALRSIARTISQLLEIVKYGLYPELTRLFYSNMREKLIKIMHYYLVTTTLACGFFIIIMNFIGESIFVIWTNGEFNYSHGTFILLLLSVLVGNAASIYTGLLQSINQLGIISWLNLLLGSACSIVILIPFNHNLETNIAAITMLAFEIIMLITSFVLCSYKLSTLNKSNEYHHSSN